MPLLKSRGAAAASFVCMLLWVTADVGRALAPPSAAAKEINQGVGCEPRRAFLKQLAFAPAVIPALLPLSPANAVVGCTTEGGACPNEDENNEFISALKAKSEANKELYRQQSRAADKVSGRQLAAQYARPKYVGCERTDGTVKMVTSSEFEELLASGKAEEVYGITKNEKTGVEKIDYFRGKKCTFTNKYYESQDNSVLAGKDSSQDDSATASKESSQDESAPASKESSQEDFSVTGLKDDFYLVKTDSSQDNSVVEAKKEEPKQEEAEQKLIVEKEEPKQEESVAQSFAENILDKIGL